MFKTNNNLITTTTKTTTTTTTTTPTPTITTITTTTTTTTTTTIIKIVVFLVREQADEFRANQQSALTQLRDECKETTEFAKQILASLNLPAALDALDPDVGLPGEVITLQLQQ